MAIGMRGFVRQTLNLGFSLQQLQLQQQMADSGTGEMLPSVKLMQENARLIVLTSEVRCCSAFPPYSLHFQRVSLKIKASVAV